jgi:hypothetical protein
MKVEVPVNRGQLGRLLAVSHRTLADLQAAGVITPAIQGVGRRASVYDALVAVPAVLRHERARGAPVNPRGTAATARRPG